MKRLFCFLICIVLCITCSGVILADRISENTASFVVGENMDPCIAGGHDTYSDASDLPVGGIGVIDRLKSAAQDLEPARSAAAVRLPRLTGISGNRRIVRGSSGELILLITDLFTSLFLPGSGQRIHFIILSGNDDTLLETHFGRFPPV